MWVLFKYIYAMSGFLLILSSCNASRNSDSASSIWSDDVSANAVFKIERRIKSNLSSFYSIEDRIMFVSRQNGDQPYDQIRAVHVDGECYSELGRSIQINKLVSSNVFSFYTFLSLEQLQAHSSRNQHVDQAYQCHFSFTGITTEGSTKSVQNIRIEIPKRPRGGIVIHHRDDHEKSSINDKFEFTQLDFKNYHVTVLNVLPIAQMTLKCSDFQETVLFHSRGNSKKNLASIFNLQKHYSLLLANPLQRCYISYGNFEGIHWAWSKSFNLLFREAFEGVFDLKFDLKKVTNSHILHTEEIERTKALWIQLGTLRVNNPFSEPMFISLKEGHNSYLNAHIYYLEDEVNYRSNNNFIKKENHDIFLQFAQEGDRVRRRNANALNTFGGPKYAFYVDSMSSITRKIIMRTTGESYYSRYKILGIEMVRSENPDHQDVLKFYFHNNRGSSIVPIFDEFEDEALISICAFRLCHRAFDAMLYNSKIRTGQVFWKC